VRSAAAHELCLLLHRAGYAACHQPLVYNGFFDAGVNDAELLATYNNVIATMNNQVVGTLAGSILTR
jgi:hypothetical protein